MKDMTKDVKVSVIVPIYGVEKYIERCVRHIFEQTYQNLDVIFVDDCSPDRSVEILKAVAEEYPNCKDKYSIVRHERNKGLGAARNTGIAYASGEFIIHVDSDDYISRNAIQCLVDKQKDTQADIVTGNAKVIRPYYSEIRQLPKFDSPRELTCALLSRTIPVNVWGRLIRLSLYRNHGISVEGNVNMSEDFNVMPRLSFFSKKIAFVDDVLFYYDCQNDNSYTSRFSEAKYEQMWTTLAFLKVFFADKDPVYIESLGFGEMKCISIALFELGKIGGNESYFRKMKLMQKKLGAKYLLRMDFPTRFAMRIRSYCFFRFFLKISVRVKHCVKKLNDKIY